MTPTAPIAPIAPIDPTAPTAPIAPITPIPPIDPTAPIPPAAVPALPCEAVTPRDCQDVHAGGAQRDGVYLVYPMGPGLPVPVYCDMSTDGHVWTVRNIRVGVTYMCV